MTLDARRILIACGVASAALSIFHIGCVFIGVPAYRYFNAGEDMALMAEAGSPIPALVTLGIAAVLATFAAYAFSGAGIVARLPFLKIGLLAVGGIYTLRGLFLFPCLVVAVTSPQDLDPKEVAFASVALAIGVAYLMGGSMDRKQARVDSVVGWR
jgi:hypothetical protein